MAMLQDMLTTGDEFPAAEVTRRVLEEYQPSGGSGLVVVLPAPTTENKDDLGAMSNLIRTRANDWLTVLSEQGKRITHTFNMSSSPNGPPTQAVTLTWRVDGASKLNVLTFETDVKPPVMVFKGYFRDNDLGERLFTQSVAVQTY